MTVDTKLPARAWLIVGLLWVVGCLNYLDRVMITTMRVSLKEAIPMTEAQFGLLTTAFLVVYAVLSPFAGYLADRFNRSRVIIVSLLVWSLITWLTGHVKTYEQLFATRLLMGISEACYLPAALALVADYHRGTTRSLATGLLLGGVMVGAAMGGVGGWLAERYHWGFAFNLFGLIGIGFAFVLIAFLRDVPRTATDGGPMPAARPDIRLFGAIKSLFGSWAFILAFIYWGLLGVAAWMVIGWMPTYLQEHFHLAQGEAGLIATMYVNVASLIGLVIGGFWADRWSRTNRRACIYVTAIGLFVSVPAILVVSHTSLLPLAIGGLVLYGLAIAFTSSEMMPILCLILDPRYIATGFGVLNLFACAVGGATTYAGGALRDMQIDVSRLFEAGAAGIAVCAVMLLFIRPRSESATKPISPMKNPLITGSFIDIQHVNNWDAQYWVDECREWRDENWDAIVGDMHAIGLDTVILTGCAIWGRPLYPANRKTVGIQLPMLCADPVGAIIRAADRRGMGVFLGLGAFGRYSLNANPDLSPEHDTWLGNMAEDLREKYGGYKALKGFYITAEAHGIKEGGLFAQEDCDKTSRFVKSIRERVGEAKLMMSPANLKKPRPEQLEPLQRQLEQLNVDIFAYQDHAGFEKVYKNLNFYVAAEGYSLIKPLHEKLGQQMWVNCEVFEYTEKRPDGRRVCTPCEFERLERQMGVAAPIADKLIIYQYQGLMSKRSSLVNIGAPGTDELHAAYVKHRAKHL